MQLSTAVLGRGTVANLLERQTAAVLIIGRDKFDRASLAGIGCFNFTAAANLSRLLNTELQVKDTRDVFEHVDPARLVLPRLGAITLAVLGAAFEAKGIGGDAPLENWYRKHLAKFVSFGALKAHDKADRPKPRAARKRGHLPRS